MWGRRCRLRLRIGDATQRIPTEDVGFACLEGRALDPKAPCHFLLNGHQGFGRTPLRRGRSCRVRLVRCRRCRGPTGMKSVADFPVCFWDRFQRERALVLLRCASATEHLNSRRLDDKTVSYSQQVKVRKMMVRKIFIHIILRTSHSGDCGVEVIEVSAAADTPAHPVCGTRTREIHHGNGRPVVSGSAPESWPSQSECLVFRKRFSLAKSAVDSGKYSCLGAR